MQANYEEEITLADQVGSFMCLREYIAWKGKAKNGSMDAEEATSDFNRLLQDPSSIVDGNGPCPRCSESGALDILSPPPLDKHLLSANNECASLSP